jgi:hypothetical protein
MPISTDTNVSPYFDDTSADKNYYKVLFKPGVAVQVRELNQLQTLLQAQIEKFGDNILQKGTVVDGCHLSFHNIFPYVKIKDVTTTSGPVVVSDYEGFYLKNSANLQAFVVTSASGYETQSPDLNTLYIRYLNSGNTGTETAFAATQVLTVFKPDNRIFKINTNNGSLGFSNTDSVVILSAVAVQNSIGGVDFSPNWSVGEYMNNGNGANVQITAVDTTSNTSAVVLRIKAQATHLVGSNTAFWTLAEDESVVGLTSSATGTVVGMVGSGATATLRTDSVGKITNVNMVTNGSNYYVDPFITIKTASANTSQVTTANLTSQSFLTQLTVAGSLTSPIGTGYGVTVTEGVIYQRGYFQRVEEQLVIVEKYANTPDVKVIGFDTEEEIINSNIDDTLLDNAQGYSNYTAPGADRLKLSPTLIVQDKEEAEANSEFFTIAEFSSGVPFRHNKQTVYNVIGKEMARRTSEESGNFVIDTFSLNTKSITPFANEASQFVTTIDPGVAYINGNRVETTENFNGAVAKAIDTEISNNAVITLSYGAFIKVNEFGGMFDFSIGSTVTFYDTVKSFLTTPATLTPAGSSIGKARIRSLTLESGTPGAPNAIYRMYLFDILMDAGKNFKNVKSVYQNVTPTGGIADVVLTDSAALLYNANESATVFSAGVPAIKNCNNITYTYRTVDTTEGIATDGKITKTLPAGESWSVTGAWSTIDKQELIVVPHANVTATANMSGSMTTATNSQNVTGTSTSFTTVLSPGDYLRYANSTANGYGRVFSITNNTFLTMYANATIAITAANAAVYFPEKVPVNMNSAVRTVNVAGQDITIFLGQATNAANCTLVHNSRVANAQPVTKTVNRDVYVRLALANNSGGYAGPWCLGHADIFRLKNVYLGANNTFASGDSGVTDITNSFYIDHNQTEVMLNSGFLYKKPGANTLSGADTLLVKMDLFSQSAEGLKDVRSYPLSDSTPLASLTTSVNTLEIPEMYSTHDVYYDLRDSFDFRPVVANTANVATIVANATLNPAEPSYSAAITSTAKKFPAPGSTLTGVFEYYVGRTDRVVVNEQGTFQVLAGEPNKNKAPTEPQNALTINLLEIPPYPSLPFSLSSNTVKIADTKIANEKYAYKRLDRFRINTPVDAQQRQKFQPRGYTMRQIGQLESRLADAEYYISYLLGQIAMLNLSPTNQDGSTSVNRYKYGYFADPFSDGKYSDLNSPEFYASFLDGRLVPKIDEFNIEFKASSNTATGDWASMEFVEQVLVAQLGATDGAVVSSNTGSNTSANTGNTTVVVQSQANVTVINKNQLSSSSWRVYEEAEYFFSSTSGPVEFYFNSRHDDIAIEIFQGTTQGFTPTTPVYTGANAVVIPISVARVKCKNMWQIQTLTPQGLQGSPPKFVTDGSGRIYWTANADNGRYWKIRIYKQNSAGDTADFIYRLYYPVDSVVNLANTTNNPTTFVYNGFVTSLAPRRFTIQSSLTYASNGTLPTMYFSDSQKFDISCSGLKPSTKHLFYFANTDNSSRCLPPGGTLGANLVSDSAGTLSFSFFYDAGLDEANTDFTRYNLMASSLAGAKTFSVESSDAASKAVGQITISTSLATSSGSGPTTTEINTLTDFTPRTGRITNVNEF